MVKRSLGGVAVVVALAFAGGCGLVGQVAAGSPGAEPAPAVSGPARSGFGTVKESGDIPDPCTLLDRDEVAALTGRVVTRIDQDGVEPGETTRFCQWQQSGGQLAVFLSRTTPEDFTVVIDEAEPVDGVGEQAFWLSNHLYVLYGTVQIDVYSHGEQEPQNRATATRVARILLPRV